MVWLAWLMACGGPAAEPTPVEPDVAAIAMAPAEPGLLTESEFAALHQLKDEAAPPLRGEQVTVAGASAYLSLPEGAAPHPGVVVIHEWWGLNDHIKHWSDRLAEAGYAALAVDLYGGTVATTRDEAMAAMKGVDEAKAGEVLAAAHAFLAEDPRVKAGKRGVIGWCFGGGWSLRHAMTVDDLDAAVIYYGRLVTEPEALAGIEAPVLGVFGRRDTGIPVESVAAFEAAMKAAGKSITVHLYDADHAFANPSGERYDAAAAEDAWGKVTVFFGENLTAPTP